MCKLLVSFCPGLHHSPCSPELLSKPPAWSLPDSLKTQPAGPCESPTQIMSLFCSKLPMVSHLRVKSKVLAMSPKTFYNPLSSPYTLASSPTTLPLVCVVPSMPASLLFLKYANHRAFALAFPLPGNSFFQTTMAHLTFFRPLLKHHLLGEVLGHSICSYNHPPSTSTNTPLPCPSPAFPPSFSPINHVFYLSRILSVSPS